MNQKKFFELLKKHNNGILRGSQRKLAKDLGYNETSISNISSGRAKPSEELIKAMSKVLKVKEEELQKIFDFSNSNNIIGDNNSMYINENKQLKERITLLEEKIKFLEEQVLFYKEKSKK